MNHPLTVGALLIGIGLLAGLLCIGGGVLDLLAEGMSDAPSESSGKSGCISALVGIVLIVASLVGLFAR